MARIQTLLVANRGEIACRVIRTARRLGIRTVAVCSSADRQALHVRLADSHIEIGAAPAADSYLRIDRILDACRRSGAQAVHPGYGFLSESAAFSRACREAGIVFVGPSPESIAALGNKSAGKQLARSVGVPCLPGYNGSAQDTDTLLAKARAVGAPLMIKAAAGGGGRGMRRIDSLDDEGALREQLDAARQEAEASFGSGQLLLERLVLEARHVEIQVFGDSHGNYLHLGERDCSTQRRNQKILEEAPGPGVSPALRDAMGQAAIELARAVRYEGAGTIEFLLAPDGSFYFLEMNTRLQVEHPVTEAVTGLDLVEWQLLVAQGEALPLSQEQIRWQGHAIEARLCAEDAWNGFVPQAGVVLAWQLPQGRAIRVDHGLTRSPVIPPHYDSMIGKLIAHGPDRESARRSLITALSETSVLGVVTNRDYLIACLQAEPFVTPRLSTAWLGQHADAFTRPAPGPAWWAIAAACQMQASGAAYGEFANFASTGRRAWPLLLAAAGQQQPMQVSTGEPGRFQITVGEAVIDVALEPAAQGWLQATVEGVGHRVHWHAGNGVACLDALGVCASLTDRTHEGARGERKASGRIACAMHGLVVKLAVQPGEQVQRGQLLLAIEAMKMQHRIESPIDGTIREIGVAEGQQVSPGRLLALVEPAASPG
ncbi:MAG: 3-methylcrotonyl-CoA carboxylase [Betaproteobacteria bacterium]|nr:3-methylcrotonyl-CoA carboxylase [Betaproteobacteria bacterium]